MKTTTTLPTDKHGEVYYGATTIAEALEKASLISDDHDTIKERDNALREYAAELRGHGYTGVAARMLKHYDLKG